MLTMRPLKDQGLGFHGYPAGRLQFFVDFLPQKLWFRGPVDAGFLGTCPTDTPF